jgi:hypothetical protein
MEAESRYMQRAAAMDVGRQKKTTTMIQSRTTRNKSESEKEESGEGKRNELAVSADGKRRRKEPLAVQKKLWAGPNSELGYALRH